MLVHPFAPLIEIEIERIAIRGCRPAHFDLRFHVRLRRPMRVHINGNRTNRFRIGRTRLPGGYSLREKGSSTHFQKIATAHLSMVSTHIKTPSYTISLPTRSLSD